MTHVDEVLAELEGRRLSFNCGPDDYYIPVLQFPLTFGIDADVYYSVADMKCVLIFKTKAECDQIREFFNII